MLQTVEAEIDVNGNIHWLEPVPVTKSRRVLVTLLAETEATLSPEEAAVRLREIAERMRANSFTGNPPRFSREELHERR
jgi:hypothetical protein